MVILDRVEYPVRQGDFDIEHPAILVSRTISADSIRPKTLKYSFPLAKICLNLGSLQTPERILQKLIAAT